MDGMTLVLAGIVTLGIRVGLLLAADRVEIAPSTRGWLRLIGPAALPAVAAIGLAGSVGVGDANRVPVLIVAIGTTLAGKASGSVLVGILGGAVFATALDVVGALA